MTPIYTKSLFALMKHLGWEQKRIAVRLGGVSDTSTSYWATGTRPISRRYQEAFLDLVAEALGEAQTAIGTHNWLPLAEIAQYLEAWQGEIYSHTQVFQERMTEALTILGSSMAKVEARSLSAEERATLQKSAMTVWRHLNYLDRAGDPYLIVDLSSGKITLTDAFAALRRQFTEEG